MARKKENSKKYIISCRVDDSEMSILRERAYQNNVSITQLLRYCLNFSDNLPRQQGFRETKQAC